MEIYPYLCPKSCHKKILLFFMKIYDFYRWGLSAGVCLDKKVHDPSRLEWLCGDPGFYSSLCFSSNPLLAQKYCLMFHGMFHCRFHCGSSTSIYLNCCMRAPHSLKPVAPFYRTILWDHFRATFCKHHAVYMKATTCQGPSPIISDQEYLMSTM